MKATITRMALAMAGSVLCLGQLHAEELGYSELEARLTKIENQLDGQNALQQAGYCCDSVSGCCDTSCCDACGGAGCDYCCGGGYYNAFTTSCWTYYSEVQLIWLRAHFPEATLFKLEETNEISPRFVFGAENDCGFGGRIRYWYYDHDTNFQNIPGAISFRMNVLDLEATQRFQGNRSDVVLSGGVRVASWDINADNILRLDSNLLGLTMAVDMRTQLVSRCDRELNLVGGGRMSLLGGDWDGELFQIFDFEFLDDNFMVWEIYAGAEYGICYNDLYLYSRLAYEVQMWQTTAIDTTLGFVGPQWTIGLAF